MKRYPAEFDFRYNTRNESDAERAETLLKGAKGKRLMYQQPREAANAQAARKGVHPLAQKKGTINDR